MTSSRQLLGRQGLSWVSFLFTWLPAREQSLICTNLRKEKPREGVPPIVCISSALIRSQSQNVQEETPSSAGKAFSACPPERGEHLQTRKENRLQNSRKTVLTRPRRQSKSRHEMNEQFDLKEVFLHSFISQIPVGLLSRAHSAECWGRGYGRSSVHSVQGIS